MSTPQHENIDVSLSLLDQGAMEAFVAELQEANRLLSSVKRNMSGQGVQAGQPSVSEMPSRPQQAPPPIAKSMVTSQGVQPLRIPSAMDPTPEDIFSIPGLTFGEFSPGGLSLPTGTSGGASSGASSPQSLSLREAIANRDLKGIARTSPFTKHLFDKETGDYNPEGAMQGVMFSMANRGIDWTHSVISQALQVLNPWTLSDTGQASGLPAGSNFGPIGNPFGQAAGATLGQHLDSVINAIKTPGLGTGEALGIETAVNAAGWPIGLGDTGDTDQLIDLAQHLKSNKFEQGKLSGLSNELMISMADQMSRFGGSSIAEIEEAFRDLPEGARGARMSLEEFANGVNQVANELQEAGLSYREGVVAAKEFANITNMAPQVMSQVMQNPFVQGRIMGEYGLPPQLHGMVGAEGVVSATLDTIDMMRASFAGVTTPQFVEMPGFTRRISAREQRDRIAANELGMGLDQMRRFEKDGRQMVLQSQIGAMADNYHKRVRQIHRRTGGPGNPEFDRQMQALREGTGRFAGDDTASWNEIMRLMERPNSGFTREHIDQLDQGTYTASERRRRIKDLIAEYAPSRFDEKGEGTLKPVNIAFTGLAEKMLKQVLSPDQMKEMRRLANQQGGGLTDQYIPSEYAVGDLFKGMQAQGRIYDRTATPRRR